MNGEFDVVVIVDDVVVANAADAEDDDDVDDVEWVEDFCCAGGVNVAIKPSAKYESHNLTTNLRGSSLINRLFIQRKANCR